MIVADRCGADGGATKVPKGLLCKWLGFGKKSSFVQVRLGVIDVWYNVW